MLPGGAKQLPGALYPAVDQRLSRCTELFGLNEEFSAVAEGLQRIVLDAQVQTFTMFGVFDCGAARFNASDWQPRRSNIFFGKGALWIVAIFSKPLEI